MTIRVLHSERDVAAAFPLMAQLRQRITSDTFLAEVRAQEAEGYVLVGGFDGNDRLIGLAGMRCDRTLARGPHLFVDDLISEPSARGVGTGTEMLRWIADYAASRGITRIYLDSRDTARGFYENIGFTFLSSIPCWVDVGRLLALPPRA